MAPAGRDGGRIRATLPKSRIEVLRSKGISFALPWLRPLAPPAIEPGKDKSLTDRPSFFAMLPQFRIAQLPV